MKFILALTLTTLLFLSSCTTPPWNEKQLEYMNTKNVNCVPIVIIEL